MLYIVPTPIGNLDDITVRSLKTLQRCKIILCEDPRVTVKLLELLKIENRPKLIQLERNHEFNEKEIRKVLVELKTNESEKVSNKMIDPETLNNTVIQSEAKNPLALETKTPNKNSFEITSPEIASPSVIHSKVKDLLSHKYKIIDANYSNAVPRSTFYIKNSLKLDEDQNIIALVSDAGTPGISDPAFEVLQLAQELNINYTTLPGATALIPAVVNSNLINKDFLFLGFLPLKKGRMTQWKRIAESKTPVVIYESCHRIVKFLEEAKTNLNPKTKICINQEISKSHENIWVGRVSEIEKYEVVEKGEFVIVVRN